MDELEQSNKTKILIELHKNARATISELAEKTGLTRQTVAKTINNLEKNKQIWGYTAIFDPKILGKKQFIFIIKLDLSKNTEDFLKKATNSKQIKENEEKYGFKTAMFLHGTSDLIISLWTKDIIEAKKLMIKYKKIFEINTREIDLLEVIATFRDNNIANPDMINEWNKLLI